MRWAVTARRAMQWAALVAGVGLWAPAGSAQEAPQTGLEAAAALEEALTAAIQRAEGSVVAIARVRRPAPNESRPALPTDGLPRREDTFRPENPADPDFVPNEFATGVVVDAKGLILTCHHILQDESEYYVTTAQRQTYRAEVLAADPRSDMAILQVPAEELTPISFGDGTQLRKGQIVLALGNPYAIARDGQVSASWGIVSNLSRRAGPLELSSEAGDRPTLHHFGTLIQTDAKLNLGTSGGALVNLRGEMVGLTTAQAALVGFEQPAGYALRVDETFHRVLAALKEGREIEYGFLGIQPANLSQVERLAGHRGARVERVIRGTPAFGKLLPGDVITRVDGAAVVDCAEMMLRVGKLDVGTLVRLTVERGEPPARRRLEVTVELTKYPVRGKKIFQNGPSKWRGALVEYPTAAVDVVMAGIYGDFPEEPCVVVLQADPDSVAWNSGLRPGMLISHVGNTPVRTPRDFYQAVAGKAGPVTLRLVGSFGQRSTLTIAAE